MNRRRKYRIADKRRVLLIVGAAFLAGSLGFNILQLNMIKQKDGQLEDLTSKLDIAWEASGDAHYNENLSAQNAATREKELKDRYNNLVVEYNSLVDDYRQYNDDPNIYIFKVSPISN